MSRITGQVGKEYYCSFTGVPLALLQKEVDRLELIES